MELTGFYINKNATNGIFLKSWYFYKNYHIFCIYSWIFFKYSSVSTLESSRNLKLNKIYNNIFFLHFYITVVPTIIENSFFFWPLFLNYLITLTILLISLYVLTWFWRFFLLFRLFPRYSFLFASLWINTIFISQKS